MNRMIVADEMNDDGFYGTLSGVKMPYLRAFQQTAVTFERACCAAWAYVPSRAAVFRGLYPHKTGCYLNGSDPSCKKPHASHE